jgi:hypothetical protein
MEGTIPRTDTPPREGRSPPPRSRRRYPYTQIALAGKVSPVWEDPRTHPARITILYLYLPFHNEPPVPFCTHKS